MGVFAKVISSVKNIEQIVTQIQGQLKVIEVVWTTVNNDLKLVYPSEYVINLKGGEKYEKDIIWPAGYYSIECSAGQNYRGGISQIGTPGFVNVQNIKVDQPFIIRAYCGSDATFNTPGTNPYTGQYKVDAYTNYTSSPPDVGHIFGNAGSGLYSAAGPQIIPGGANCLGDGAEVVVQGNTGGALGAGSCIHFIPINGTFGQNYLFAAHCCAGTMNIPSSVLDRVYGGNGGGSAHGGAGSASACKTNSYSFNSLSGGNTLYGNAGQGVIATNNGLVLGNSGQGIGAGPGGGATGGSAGAACYFDGVNWINGNVGENIESSIIKVRYVSKL